MSELAKLGQREQKQPDRSSCNVNNRERGPKQQAGDTCTRRKPREASGWKNDEKARFLLRKLATCSLVPATYLF